MPYMDTPWVKKGQLITAIGPTDCGGYTGLVPLAADRNPLLLLLNRLSRPVDGQKGATTTHFLLVWLRQKRLTVTQRLSRQIGAIDDRSPRMGL